MERSGTAPNNRRSRQNQEGRTLAIEGDRFLMQTDTPAGTNAPPTITTTPPTQSAGNRPSAVSVLDILSASTRPSSLTVDGKKYISDLDNMVASHGIAIQTVTTARFEAVIATSANNTGVALILQETFRPTDDMPALSYIEEMLKVTGAKNVQLIETIVVTKDDYSKIEQMAGGLINLLITRYHPDTAALSASMFGRDETIVVDTSINAVRRYVEQVSPHAVPARSDVGFLLSLRNNRAMNQQPMAFGVGRDETPETPFCAVTGYTEIIEAPASHFALAQYPAAAPQRYMPVIHLTDIVTTLPVSNLLALVLPIAAEVFIRQQRWLEAFGFTEGKMNLGNVMIDPDDKMVVVKNMEEMQGLVAQCFEAPFLAIDVIDGRYRIPGIEGIVSHETNGEIVSAIGTFLNEAYAQNESYVVNSWPILPGNIVWDGENIDSRYAEYLFLAQRIQDTALIGPLMRKSDDPMVRVNQVKAVFDDKYLPLYLGDSMVLNGQFVSRMAARFGSIQLPVAFKQATMTISQNVANLIASHANQFTPTGMNTGGTTFRSGMPGFYNR